MYSSDLRSTSHLAERNATYNKYDEAWSALVGSLALVFVPVAVASTEINKFIL